MSFRHKRRAAKHETNSEEPTTEQTEPEVLEPEVPSTIVPYDKFVELASSVVESDPLPEKEKEEVIEKKTKRKRKAKVEVVDASDGISTPTAPPPKKSKKDQLVEDFMITQLPALRKEIKLRKKEQSTFNIRDYPDYFKAGSEYTPTYCLSLFNFLGKNEIVCSQYGCFDKSRHMVKTNEGFTHASLIISSLGDTISPEESEHMISRFGREWFKIPAKDSSRASTAFRFGEGHQFKVVLTGIYNDSFFADKGEEILTVNPILRYEPLRAPSQKVKKEKKSQEDKSEPVVDQPAVERVDEIL